MNEHVVTGKTEVASAVSVVVELIEKGGQIDKMTHSKKGQLLIRQIKEHLTGLCEMVSRTVHLGMSVQAFAGDRVDLTGEDLQIGRLVQGLMNSHQSEHSMAMIVHHDEAVGIVGAAVTVLVLETAVKEQTQMMPKAKTMALLMSGQTGKHLTSREIEGALANGKNGKDLMKMWNGQDSRIEEVDESSFVVAEEGDVDLVEVGVVLIDLERETTIDTLKGMLFPPISHSVLFLWEVQICSCYLTIFIFSVYLVSVTHYIDIKDVTFEFFAYSHS